MSVCHGSTTDYVDSTVIYFFDKRPKQPPISKSLSIFLLTKKHNERLKKVEKSYFTEVKIHFELSVITG